MSDLSAKIAVLKGKRKTSHVVQGADVSRATFRKIELGQSIKLSTLREIARALGVTDESPEWLELVVAWIKTEVGLDAHRLWIEPRDTQPSALRDVPASDTAKAMMLFTELNSADRIEITKAMQRPEVRACLPAINSVWDKLGEPSSEKVTKAAKTREEQQAGKLTGPKPTV